MTPITTTPTAATTQTARFFMRLSHEALTRSLTEQIAMSLPQWLGADPDVSGDRCAFSIRGKPVQVAAEESMTPDLQQEVLGVDTATVAAEALQLDLLEALVNLGLFRVNLQLSITFPVPDPAPFDWKPRGWGKPKPDTAEPTPEEAPTILPGSQADVETRTDLPALTPEKIAAHTDPKHAHAAQLAAAAHRATRPYNRTVLVPAT